MLRVLIGLLLAAWLVTACGAPAPAEPQVSEPAKPLVTVYKSPT